LTTALYGLLAIIAIALSALLAVIGSFYVRKLERRPTLPISDEVGSAQRVVRKLRKREPMTAEELEFAEVVVNTRGSFRAVCIPGALFFLGLFYVLGSLEHLHGATPSERTFLGLIPMLTSTNLAIQLMRHMRLRSRLREATVH
jgi:hypothetical protein